MNEKKEGEPRRHEGATASPPGEPIMSKSRRLAAVVLALSLGTTLVASPLLAAGRSTAATKASPSPLSAAWSWLLELVCDDNGGIVP